MPRIACPSCGARYDVAAGVISPAGKSVRCARCGHLWLARPEGAEVVAEAPPQWPEPPPPRVRELIEEPPPRPRPAPLPPPPAPAVEEAAPPAPRPRRGGRGAAVAWMLSLLLVGAAAYGALTHKRAVIEAWPASARLYAMLGLIE